MQSERKSRRIVVKIGSSFLYTGKKMLDTAAVDTIAAEIAELSRQKIQTVLVSSGAIAIGMSVLKFANRPKELACLQAAASVGQHFLMSQYSSCLNKYQLECGQVLLTWEDFNDRSRYLNAKNTLLTLLRLGIVPVINENDTVSTDEIKFGDNDRLSALVSNMVSAEMLIILSDVDGLLDAEKRVIPVVDKITPDIKRLACPTNKKTCVGGMVTKLEAARIVVDSGIACVIAHGKRKNIIQKAISEPQQTGTLFLPQKGLAARQRWIAFATKPKARITIDDGARQALINNKSLLAVGITAIEGSFDAGQVVSIIDTEKTEFARGKIGIGSSQLEKIMGKRFHKEVMHCDDIVIV